jgi:predicted transposase YbfD/YdcC
MRKKSTVDANCLNCGIEFKANKWNHENGLGKYCSRSCSAKVGYKAMRNLMPSQDGEHNPNWRGGISKEHYRYTKPYKENNPEKISAHRKMLNALRTGKINKRPCEVCGELKVDAHHDDYTKPIEVRWLCRKHHIEHHKSQ